MREYTSPVMVPADPKANLTDAIVSAAMATPNRVAIRRQLAGAWTDVSSAQFRDQVVALAKGLVAAGIGPGDRIGLISRTRYEWTLTDYAIWFAGAVTVPIYETSSAEQVAWILSDSGAAGVVVETERHRATVTGVRDRLPDLAHLWTIDDGMVADLVAAGAAVGDDQLEARRQSLTADSVATLIYTSGTLKESFATHLAPEQRGWLDELAPVSISWHDGRKIKLLYSEETDPVKGEAVAPEAQVKLQECFPLPAHPLICEGVLPVKLWLCAPDGKRIEATLNWLLFKTNSYPKLKPALQKKFPGVPWI